MGEKTREKSVKLSRTFIYSFGSFKISGEARREMDDGMAI